MSDYTLDQDVEESFNFNLKGNMYTMRYPTTEEVQSGQELKDPAEQTKWLYDFITPETDGAPSIEDALKTVNVKVLRNFNKMIKSEFSGDGDA